jgi:hypothetical protein
MRNDSSWHQDSPFLSLSLLIYIFLGVFFFTCYQHHINNLDAISYISIARKYLQGDVANAVNGFWGPLLSWLLVPFLFFGADPVPAARIINLFIGLLTLIGAISLSYRMPLARTIRRALFFILIPIVQYYAYTLISPDLLVVCLLVAYFNCIFAGDYPRSTGQGVLCGLIGALAYLAKSYLFPFFILHFNLFSFLHYARSTTAAAKKQVRNCVVWGLAVFFIISGAWAGLISNKYGEMTIGTAGRYNFLMLGPHGIGHPAYYKGKLTDQTFLMDLPNESAINPSEDPSYFTWKTWSPFESWRSFEHLVNLFSRNLMSLFTAYQSFSFLSTVIILLYGLYGAKKYTRRFLLEETSFPLLTMILFPLGYTVLLVEARYVWINNILILLMGGFLLTVLFSCDFMTAVLRRTVLLIFAGSFAVMPAMNLLEEKNKGKDIYVLSEALRRQYYIKGSVASNEEWYKTSALTFHLNCRFFSVTKRKSELLKYNIDYYFLWNYEQQGLAFLADYKEITGGTVPGLRIYSLRDTLHKSRSEN